MSGKSLKRLTLLVCLLVLSATPALSTANAKVVFLSAGPADSPFFSQAIKIMQVAASDLELDLEVVYGDDDLFVIREQAKALFMRTNRPDYLVMLNHRDITVEVMRQADEYGVNTLLFNSSFSDDVFTQFRHGPNPLHHWIGQVIPNDEQSGRLVAQKLIEQAREANARDEQGKIQVVAINGSLRSVASAKRKKGLLAYINEQDDVVLNQVVNANWSRPEARDKTQKLLQRFKDTTVVWTAADYMALGAAQAIEDSGMQAGQDVFTAGVDCLPAAFEPIRAGKLAGCAGGHSFDAAWAMVVIYDHLHKHAEQFVNEKTKFYWSTARDLSTMNYLVDTTRWDNIDFKTFSKTHKGEKPYNFSARLIVESANTSAAQKPKTQ